MVLHGIATLTEIETQWSWEELLEANLALDYEIVAQEELNDILRREAERERQKK